MPTKSTAGCLAEDCDRPYHARGYCDRHYQKYLRPRSPSFYRMAMRARAIQKLGGECVCCGETEVAFLVIDHIEGGGTKRRGGRTGGAAVYAEVRRVHDDPDNSGCQVLCANCNMAKERTEGCPHQRATQDV